MTGADVWQVPPALAERFADDTEDGAWLRGLPSRAASLAAHWDLRPDGDAWSGFNSAVWPVHDRAGRPLVLKVSRPSWPIEPEAIALQVWAGRGAVRCHGHAADDNAVLLQRLDGHRSLDSVADVDDACLVAASVLAELHRAPPPVGFRHLTGQAQSLAEDIRQLSRGPLPGVLTRRQVDQALATWDDVGPDPADRLVHNDAHFLNLLATVEGEPPWLAIDPYPFVGPVEVEVIPLLRNRWADAVATGDPDAALRHRVDAVSDALGGDPQRARALAQATAVVTLLGLLRSDPDHFFVPPFTLVARWS